MLDIILFANSAKGATDIVDQLFHSSSDLFHEQHKLG